MKKTSTKLFLMLVLAISVMSVSAQQFSTMMQRQLDQPNQERAATFSPNDYCIPGSDCSYNDGFTSFSFAGIDNPDSGCSDGGYGDFTSLQGTAEIGTAYTASFTTGYGNQLVCMWIDFNDDQEFTENERILTDYVLPEAATFETDITIPGYGLPGVKRLRIGAGWGESVADDPCGTPGYGEWEDYMIEITGESVSKDVATLSIDMLPIIGMGDATPKATVFNYGVETATFPITLEIEGTSYTSTAQVTDLASGYGTQVEFDTWNAEVGTFNLTATSNFDGDSNPDNDVATYSVDVIAEVPTKRVVGEEGTGTWCGWCVRGAVFMEYMHETYPDTWIGIAVHNGDPMVVAEYDTELGITGFPGAFVGRSISADPSEFEAVYNDEINVVAPAFIEIKNRTYNPDTRELSFDAESRFIINAENYRMSGILVENGVTGEGADWAQANYYAGGANGEMGGYELLENPVPAADMVYNEVARAIIGGFYGAEESLPGTIAEGETHSYTFTTTLEEEWDAANIEVVALLINFATGEVVNGAKEHLMVSVEELASIQNLHVYPNPANQTLNIANVEQSELYIYNINGSLVKHIEKVEGNVQIDISNLANGAYFVKLVNDNEILTSKVNVLK